MKRRRLFLIETINTIGDGPGENIFYIWFRYKNLIGFS